MSEKPCEWCNATYPHRHAWFVAPDGQSREAVIVQDDKHPRAEVRDSETGEVLFPAVKGPLRLVR